MAKWQARALWRPSWWASTLYEAWSSGRCVLFNKFTATCRLMWVMFNKSTATCRLMPCTRGAALVTSTGLDVLCKESRTALPGSQQMPHMSYVQMVWAHDVVPGQQKLQLQVVEVSGFRDRFSLHQTASHFNDLQPF